MYLHLIKPMNRQSNVAAADLLSKSPWQAVSIAICLATSTSAHMQLLALLAHERQSSVDHNQHAIQVAY